MAKNSSHLMCPTCLQEYNTPKLLPCLHSFCRHCLEKCIEKSTVSEDKVYQFQCSMCAKTVTKPSDLPVEKWAGHFPVNAVLLSLLPRAKTKTKVDQLCDPCLYEGTSIAATSYCTTCKEALCEMCDSAHRKSRATREHSFLTLDEIADPPVAFSLAVGIICTYHLNKDMEFYYASHDSMCCSDCVVDYHRGCNEILKLKQHADKLFKAEEPLMVTERIKQLEGHLDKYIAANNEILQELEISTEYMTVEIDKLIDTLHKVKSRISMEREGLLEEESRKRRNIGQQCQSLKAALRDSLNLLDAVVKYGNKYQNLVILHKIKEQLAYCEKTIHDKHSDVRQVEAMLQLNEHFISLRKLTDSQIAKIEITENKLKQCLLVQQNYAVTPHLTRTMTDEGLPCTSTTPSDLASNEDENAVEKSSDFDGHKISVSDFSCTLFDINKASKDVNNQNLEPVRNKREASITSENTTAPEKIQSKPQRDQEDNETPRMIRVQGLAKSVSQDALEMLFENKKKSGGGEIESVEYRSKGEAFITFKDPSVVQSVLEKQKREPFYLEQLKLRVEEYVPLPPDPLRLFLKNLSPRVTHELLHLYLESHCKATPTEVLFGKLPGTALVTFPEPPDVGLILRKVKEKSLEGHYIQVIRVPITCCVQLTGLPLSITRDTVELYFENRKRSGGGPMKDLKFRRENQSCVVSFENAEVAKRVCMRSHTIDKKDIKVCLYYECVDDELDADEYSDLTHRTEYKVDELKLPDPVELKDLNPQILRFLLKNEKHRQMFENNLSDVNGVAKWPSFAQQFVIIECTVKIQNKSASSVLKDWSIRVMDKVNSFVAGIEVVKFNPLEMTWSGVIERLQTITVDNPEDLGVFVEPSKYDITVAGPKAAVQTLKKTILAIIKVETQIYLTSRRPQKQSK